MTLLTDSIQNSKQNKGGVFNRGCHPVIGMTLVTRYYLLLKTLLQPLVPADGTELRAYHIVWVTHNSRVSERMVTFGVKCSDPVILSESMECEITEYIKQVILEDNLKVLAHTICQDHVHMVLVCSGVARDNIVRKLKGKSAQYYKENHRITDRYNLWAQKYHWEELTTDAQFENTLSYVTYNRQKHKLSVNEALQEIVDSMIVSTEGAFRI
jgi:REP element-mobilizing transposase RayT